MRSTTSLEERIAALERAARFYRAAFAGIVVMACAASILQGAQQQPPSRPPVGQKPTVASAPAPQLYPNVQDAIQTRRLELIDYSGRRVASFAATPSGPELVMLDDRGRTTTRLTWQSLEVINPLGHVAFEAKPDAIVLSGGDPERAKPEHIFSVTSGYYTDRDLPGYAANLWMNGLGKAGFSVSSGAGGIESMVLRQGDGKQLAVLTASRQIGTLDLSSWDGRVQGQAAAIPVQAMRSQFNR